jgi:murein DD-endopeptidase MepM/ murein hydrolase activator NlpD
MSNLPDLKRTWFSYLVANNRPYLDNFKRWIFQPGMLFNSLEKWWGDKGARPAPHEGLDLCSFEDVNGKKKTLDRHTKIPAAFAGEIVKIGPDFLGKSIYISHEIFDECARQLYSAYGHTVPRDSLQTGSRVAEGETIAVISDLSGKKLAIVPHVHITFAWIPVPMAVADLHWENLGKKPDIMLIDPLSVLGLDFP